MAVKIPEHWGDISWEEKAKENPLFAVMTTEDVADASADNFDPTHLEPFLAKGRRVYEGDIKPLLTRIDGAPSDIVVAEHGCGVGRILLPISEDGYKCVGIDISETMLKHCRTIAPKVTDLHLLDANGRSAVSDDSVDLLFSFAVVKHIAKLSNFVTAIDEMCRVLKPGGILALTVNTEDFQHGDIETPYRTVNEETHSLHFRPGEKKPYSIHNQDNWSGVYIGHHLLMDLLEARGISIERRYYLNKKKLRGVWYIGAKRLRAVTNRPE